MICLVPQCGYLSETSRMIELHRALTAIGAPVRMAVHGGTYEWLLRQAGIAYDVIGPPLSEARSAELVRNSPGLGDVRQSVYSRAELTTYARAEAQYFRDQGVRAVVTGFTLTTLLSSRLAGVPLVTEHNGSWLPPVWEAGLIPVPTLRGRPWARVIPPPVARRLVNAAPPRVRWYTGPINEVARELGVDEIPSMAALTLGDVALLTELPQVVQLPAAAFENWRTDGRRGYRKGTRLAVAGPIYARLAVKVPPAADRFLDRAGPMVYVAMTSAPKNLVRKTVGAVRAAGANVLVAGTTHDLGDLDGDGVHIEQILPSEQVMSRVDVAVTTAGQGSMQTAMATGTPVIGVPLQPEQDLNVVLLERLGAARRVTPQDAGSRRLTVSVAELLADPAARAAARRVKSWYDHVDGAAEAARIIVDVAEKAT